jgi:predicted metal-dependent hydrolase
MSFPVGEEFFIDSVRNGLAGPAARTAGAVPHRGAGFRRAEATHRRLHSLYNAHLEKLGLVNAWEGRARKRLQQMEGLHARHWLGITAANEHFTAILADFMLNNPDLLGEQDPRLATLWLWHSAEESEHKSTAFDLYQALGG